MRLFTKFFFTAALAVSSLLANAATHTVMVGSNFYAPQQLTIALGDVVNFVWQAGNHPTASDTGAWSTFPMNTNNRTFSLTLTTLGVYPYHCTAHGAPGVGQIGVITVRMASSNTNALTATPVLNLFPNPSKGGQVTVKLDQKAGQDYKLRLSNIIGREIRMVALKPELTEAGLQLDLSDLPAGMYFYNLLVNDKVVSTKRLVLQD